MKCPICNEEVATIEQAEKWGSEFAHSRCVVAYNHGKADAAPEAPAQGGFVHDPACKMCEGRGYYVAGYSGREDDGNAPIHEECDCWIPNPEPPAQPIDMILHCPACGMQHIDAPDERTPDWKNEPHRSHLCHGCGHIWRPADVPTNGVAAIKTKGKADSPAPEAPARAKETPYYISGPYTTGEHAGQYGVADVNTGRIVHFFKPCEFPTCAPHHPCTKPCFRNSGEKPA